MLNNDLSRYRPVFYAAALYNLIWGAVNVLFPFALFDLLGIDRPSSAPLWQVVGMFVLVYAPAYFWAARRPERHAHLIAIGFLGKVCGPLGFVWSALSGQLPLAFGWTILANDVLWWPAFGAYLLAAVRAYGGPRRFLLGEAP